MTAHLQASAVFVALSSMLAACAGGTPEVSAIAPSLSEWVSDPLDAARASGADDAQVDVLVRGLQTGEITYSDLQPLLDLSYECIEDVGFSIASQEPQYLTPDLPYPVYVANYGPNIDLGTALPLLDECENRYTTFVLRAYADQPTVIEFKDSQFEAIRDDAIACLRENGFAVDDDVSRDELSRLSLDLVDVGLQAGKGLDEVVWCIPQDLL